jgi:hypothetical protein
MDDELFAQLYQIVRELWPRREKSVQCAGRTVVLMYLGSVIRNKPRQWVCDPRNLPEPLREQRILGRCQFGRRLRSTPIQRMLVHLDEHLRGVPADTALGAWLLDAKPLIVSPYSKDKAAKWGHAYDRKARGYKLFAMTDLNGRIVSWQVHAMNGSEPVIAKQLIQHTDRPGYVVGDSIYDSGPLHEAAASRDLQLIAPRKVPGGNIGVRARQPTRLHAIAMLETFCNSFGRSLYNRRTAIERSFSRMGCSKIGLDRLPPFIRTPPRVEPWIRGKIILYSLLQKQHLRQ